MENYFYRKLVFAKSKSSGTSNYADLSNKPQINGVELVGNKTSEDLGIEQGVTEEVLTQALAAESAAREKQDELLQGEIEGKIAAANILAGENIEVSQEGNNVTISSTAEGKTYTAGKNIEITEENVINNTVPFVSDISGNGILFGNKLFGKNEYFSGGVSIGYNSTLLLNPNDTSFKNIVLIGNGTGNGSYGINNIIAIGNDAKAMFNNSIALGIEAKTTKEKQMSIGSSSFPINEMKVVTSDGDKYIATTDQTVPSGGTTGQVLMKNSDTDYDFGWASLADYDEVSF